MASVKGNNVSLYIDSTPTGNAAAQDLSSGYVNIQGVTSASVSCSNATYETQFKSVTNANGSDAAPVLTPTRAYAVGTTTTTLNIEGIADPALSNAYDDIDTLCRNKTECGVFWVADVSSGKAVGGVGFCTQFELSANIDDFVTFSATFELNGDPAIKAAP